MKVIKVKQDEKGVVVESDLLQQYAKMVSHEVYVFSYKDELGRIWAYLGRKFCDRKYLTQPQFMANATLPEDWVRSESNRLNEHILKMEEEAWKNKERAQELTAADAIVISNTMKV